MVAINSQLAADFSRLPQEKEPSIRNEKIRLGDNWFNLIIAPGFPENVVVLTGDWTPRQTAILRL